MTDSHHTDAPVGERANSNRLCCSSMASVGTRRRMDDKHPVRILPHTVGS